MHDVRAEPVPLSYGQQRLWFLDQLAGGSPHYNILEAQRWRGSIDVRALARTVSAVVARHATLRTHFVERDGEPLQVIEPPTCVPLPVIDLSGLGEARQALRVRRLLRGERAHAFDLARGPLIRVTLVRVAPEEYIFLRSIHHIAYDGWSRGIMNREVAVLYDAFCSGQPDPLAPLPFQYADFAVWQRQWFEGTRLQEGLAYWKAQLEGLPERLELPADRPRPAVPTYGAGVCVSTVSAPCLAALKRLSREHRTTLYMTLLAGFGVLLARYAGQDDVSVGTPISDRRDQRLEGLIGLFVNLIVLRVRVQPSMRTRELLTDVRRTALDAFTHQNVPFERVVEVVAPHRSPDRLPLFQILFAVQNVPLVAAQLGGVNVEPVHLFEAGAGVDLEVYVGERQGELEIAWDYSRDLFDGWRIDQMARHYVRILEGMAADPDAPIEQITTLDAVERHQILEAWNATSHPRPDVTLAAQFAATVEAMPDAVAVTSGDQSLTYRALNAQANRLAHLLLARGTSPEDVVAIAVPRSIDLVIALLGTLKTGAAYLPLDTEAPAPRLAFMLADARPRWVLTASAMLDRLHDGNGRLVLDAAMTKRALAASGTGEPAIASRAPDPQQAAYILYTSGSTGTPKGVVGTQGGYMNRLAWFASRYDYRQAGPVLGKSPFSFIDGSSELLGPLLHGGRVVLADADAAKSASALGALIAREGVGLVTVVPALLRALVEDGPRADLGQCRVWVSSGEALPAPTSAAFAEAWPDADLLNLYGASEAAGDSLCGVCRDGDNTIGDAVWNTRVYILDKRMAPVPIGVPGELYVAGAGVARGYLRQPALTAERFLPDPYGAPGTRMYRMGDVARRRVDGRVDFLGRTDDQVKIRGCRVEPGELQAALVRSHGVADAAVIAQSDARGETCLIGYVVPEAGARIDPRSIRELLRQTVPDYLVPAAIVPLDRLPLTPHGKLDRRALPAPDLTPSVAEAPKTREEEQLCAMFAEILGVDRVGTGDDFFDLGGHSILAMRLLNRLRSAFGVELTLRALFDAPTVGELAQRLVKS